MGLTGNLVRFGATLDNKVSSELKRLRGEFDGVTKSRGFGAMVEGAGLSIGSAAWSRLAGSAGMAVDVVMGSIQAASSMNETLSKSKAVFGDAASGVEEWGNTAASSFGQSKAQAIEAAASFGNLFKTMGVGEGPTLTMSKGLVQLASDLASFNNQDPTEVLAALQSGLVGEIEAVRRFGIALSSASVEEKVMAMGLATTRNEITESMKVQARYALIMEQTVTAQGDFTRTADGLANSQRTLNSQLADASAELGEKFLPIMLTLAKFAKDTLVPALGMIIDNFDKIIVVGTGLAVLFGVRMTAALRTATVQMATTAATSLVLGNNMVIMGTKTAASAGLISRSWTGLKGVAGGLAGAVGGMAGVTAIAATAVFAVFQSISSDLDKQAEALTAKTTEWVKTASVAQLQAAQEGIKGQLDKVPTIGPWDVFGGKEKVQGQLDIVAAELKSRQGKAWHDAMVAANEEVDAGAGNIVKTYKTGISPMGQATKDAIHASLTEFDLLRSGWAAVEADIETTLADIAETIRDPKQRAAFEDLSKQWTEQLEKPMTGEQRKKLLTEFIDGTSELGKAVAQAATSNDPIVAEGYRGMMASAREYLARQDTDALMWGKDVGPAMASGIEQKEEAVYFAAREVNKRLWAGMPTTTTFASYGYRLTAVLAGGMTSASALAVLKAHLRSIGRTASEFLRGKSPPPQGPFHEIDRWGEGVGKTWATSFASGAARFDLGAVAERLREAQAAIARRREQPFRPAWMERPTVWFRKDFNQYPVRRPPTPIRRWPLLPTLPLPLQPPGNPAGPRVINLTYAPVYSTASPAEARRFAAAILPELVRQDQRWGG